MSIWTLSDGSSATEGVTGEYEIGGSFEPIPNGSSVLAMIDEAKWEVKNDVGSSARYVSLRWVVLAPDEVKGRKVYQKLWVDNLDPAVSDPAKAEKKRDKARRMIAAIDKNAGARLARVAGDPDDEDLAACLANKPMVIRVQIWELEDRQTGEPIRGNWVSQVAPKTHELHVTDDVPASKPARPAGAPVLDDEIPF